MTLRDNIQSKVLQKTRPLLASLGFRPNSLAVVVRTWTGKPGTTGVTYTDLSTDLFPIPKIRKMSTDEVASSGGKYQAGDLVVTRLSPKHATGGYDPEDLRPALAQHQELLYVTTGPDAGEFELRDFDSSKNFEYVLVIRRRRTTPFKGSDT